MQVPCGGHGGLPPCGSGQSPGRRQARLTAISQRKRQFFKQISSFFLLLFLLLHLLFLLARLHIDGLPYPDMNTGKGGIRH